MKISSLHKDNYEFIEAPNLPTVQVNANTTDAVIIPSKAEMVNFILKNIEGDDLQE
ncbi:hypothetical protein [Sphingobacterium sp. UBA1498]|uniref:hypothetical protein n=1 Tax=Sphingobacterium sp. UBA1498 TaxID=1947481 RepID=UPI0025F71034|nr:hypothetical protein [Sphingobacterium sp. UBA1498]